MSADEAGREATHEPTCDASACVYECRVAAGREATTHDLSDLSQDTSGMWWWACSCGATSDDAVLSAMEAASDYLGHRAESPPASQTTPPPRPDAALPHRNPPA